MLQTELKMPKHFPPQFGNCALAAHDHTLRTRTRKPNHLMPDNSQEWRQTQQEPYCGHSSLSPIHLAVSSDIVNGEMGSQADMRRDHGDHVGQRERDEDSLSAASEDTKYAGSPGNNYSIVIRPLFRGGKVSLVRAEVLVKSFGFDGLKQNDEGMVENMLSEPEVTSDLNSLPTKYQSSSSPNSTLNVPTLKLDEVTRPAEPERIASTPSAISKLTAWSQNKDNDKGKVAADTTDLGPKVSTPVLHPRDDPGIPGIGWVEGQVAGDSHAITSHNRTPVNIKAFRKPSASIRASPRQQSDTKQSPKSRTLKDLQKPSPRRVAIVGIIPSDSTAKQAANPTKLSSAQENAKVNAQQQIDEGAALAAQLSPPMSARDTEMQGALDKLRVWQDDESECESVVSDTLDVVTTTMAMPARMVQFLRSPKGETQERIMTPNTSREEQLCEWEDSARGRESARERRGTTTHSNYTRTASRRASTQGSRLPTQASTLSSTPGRKYGRGRDLAPTETPYSGTSSRASRYMTGDSRAVHEYVAVSCRDSEVIPQYPWQKKLGAAKPHLSVVSFFHEPTPGIPMGTSLRGGKVRHQIFENQNFLPKCDQVIERTGDQEALADRFLPVPLGEAEAIDYSQMLREQGIQPFVLDWGSGMAMRDVPLDDIFGEEEDNYDNIKYYPTQQVPGSEIRSAQLRRRKVIRINPSGTN